MPTRKKEILYRSETNGKILELHRTGNQIILTLTIPSENLSISSSIVDPSTHITPLINARRT